MAFDHCFNKIIHLENTELQEFDGRYIDYNFSLLQTKIELQEMAIADEEEIARNEELIKILREKAYRQLELLRKNQDTIAALKKNLIEDTETNG